MAAEEQGRIERMLSELRADWEEWEDSFEFYMEAIEETDGYAMKHDPRTTYRTSSSVQHDHADDSIFYKLDCSVPIKRLAPDDQSRFQQSPLVDPRQSSNDAGPSSPIRHEMEGSGAGALVAAAAPATALPENTHAYESHATYRMTDALDRMENAGGSSDVNNIDWDIFPALQQSRAHHMHDGGAHTSEVQHPGSAGSSTHRDSIDSEHAQPHVSPISTNAAFAANTLANLTAGPLALDTNVGGLPIGLPAAAKDTPLGFFPTHYPFSAGVDEGNDLGFLDETF
ncbi:hypothetical protein LTR53_014031, partial [Teratosphaeriaceae sp. CCFEE 6253]